MKITNLLIGFVALILLGTGVTMLRSLTDTDASPDRATEAEVVDALSRATVTISDVGADNVTLQNGSATFSTGPEGSAAQGSIVLGDVYEGVFSNDTAEVFAILGANGGGTGTFSYLARFHYSDATHTVHFVGALLLGDRIGIDGLNVTQVASGTYDVLVSIRDRAIDEPMATVPVYKKVLHIASNDTGLKLKEVIFGTVESPTFILAGPLPNTIVPNGTITVTGAVHGPWYFEASFPFELATMEGEQLVASHAEALEDWMTEQLVPFRGTLETPPDAQGSYMLIFRNDNPSGDPAKDQRIEVPIVVQ